MKTRSRFILLFVALGLLVMATGLGAIFRAVALDSARRLPLGAERLLAVAAEKSLDETIEPGARLEAAASALREARSLLAQNRVMAVDPVIALALQVAAILAALLGTAALVFFLFARFFTRGLEELRLGVERAGRDRGFRFPPSKDAELAHVREALNALLDLTAEQEKRLQAASRLEGWREVASFLAHQVKNPLAALGLAADNGLLALEARRGTEGLSSSPKSLARESLAIVKAETGRLAALVNRFRDLAPAGLEAYRGGEALPLRSVVETCAARARERGARVDIEGPELTAAADRALLEQALWNLFANSVEAAGDEDPSIRVEIDEVAAEGREGRMGRIRLSDSNNFIDPAIVEGLGRDRVTTKRGGTGLGLVLVRRILALLGGDADFGLSPTGGLLVTLRVPLAGPRP